MQADGQSVEFTAASHSYAKNRFGANPVSAQLAVDGDPQTGWSVDGRLGERHYAIFVLEEPLEQVRELTIEMMFGRHFASSLGRFRLSVTTQEGSAALDLPPAMEALLLLPDNELDNEQRQDLREAFFLQAEELAESSQRIRQLSAAPQYPTTLVMPRAPPGEPAAHLCPPPRRVPSTHGSCPTGDAGRFCTRFCRTHRGIEKVLRVGSCRATIR